MMTTAFGAPANLQAELNNYFAGLDEAFAKIVDAGAVRSTSLRPAERLFIREMRKNRAYTEFLRTNSKGVIISEVVRGQKVERSMRDVADQKWYKKVSDSKEAYYTLIKDNDRGRYYLFWARPVLKRNDRFVGSVVAKIDLWDSFYEFSNSVYVPFLIKLGRKSLFAHKWKDGSNGAEKELTIPGIEKIAVVFSGDTKPETTVAQKDTAPAAAASVNQEKSDSKPPKKKGGAGVLIFLLIVLFIGIAVASFMLIAWMRRRAFLKHLDEDDDEL